MDQSAESPPPSAQPFAPAFTSARLAQLGFTGRHYNGVECLVPPTVLVTTGEFIMGSDKTKDPQAYDDELPQYVVHVDQFAMGTYPVTVAEYDNCSATQHTAHRRSAERAVSSDGGRPPGNGHPAVGPTAKQRAPGGRADRQATGTRR